MVGELVMGRFRLLERLGTGGMGTVYRGFDERLQRYVAVKEIAAGIDSQRVLREAQAAARLNHPCVVTLYEFGMEGSRALLVSELVAGATLAQAARGGEITDRDVAEIGADLCDALAHAHERGVVHRDVKPQNVIVRDEDWAGRRAKLMDFGIAAVAGSPTLTATGEVIGTLAYMAPEQAEGLDAGAEADVYSLTLTLYECWAGENPVAGRTPAQTARRIGEELPSLARLRPDLPRELAERIDECLAPDLEARPGLDDLHRTLQAQLPWLDDERCVPASQVTAPRGRDELKAIALRAVATVAVALLALSLARYGDRPGLGLALALLALPATLAPRPLRAAALPLLAAPLAALGAAAAYPAAVAIAARGAAARAVLGALGWCWLLAASTLIRALPDLGIAGGAPHGWQHSSDGALHGVLAPLVEPEALLGAGIFALAAVTLGWIVRAGHVAMALLAALVWAAGLSAGLAFVGDGAMVATPAVAAAAALAAVLVGHRDRLRPQPAQAPRPRTVRALPHPG